MSRGRRVLAVVGALGVVAVSFGIAFAFLNSSRGTGTATTGTLQVSLVALAGGDTPSSTLVPGGQGDLVFKVETSSNANLTSVVLKSGGAITADGGHPGCSTTGVTIGNPSNLPLALVKGTNVVHLTNGVAMSASSSSGCQGAIFSVPVTITVQT
jgi:hypothetical protein